MELQLTELLNIQDLEIEYYRKLLSIYDNLRRNANFLINFQKC